MRRLAIAIALLGLAGCATVPQVVTKTVEVPVTTKCTPDIGPEPQYADSDAALRAAANIFERVKLMLAGREQRIAREAEKTVALRACGADL